MKTGNIAKVTAIFLLCALGLLAVAAQAALATATGYSEYYIPGNENAMALARKRYGTTAPSTDNTHVIISITAWSDDVTVYYDHWENGFGFDPNNPSGTADEILSIAKAGDTLTLDNGGAAIPIPRTAALFYDGGDRLYVSGGTVTVTRASYSAGRTPLLAVQACAWEIYPVTPQLTAYVLPFGENLSGTMPDFLRVFVLIQATADNTTFQVDLDGTGTFDKLDTNFDGTINPGEPDTITLQAGQTFILGPTGTNPQIGGSAYPNQGAMATVNSNTLIQGSSTLQVKFIIGNPGVNYETRGLSCFPRGYWSTDYYAPVGQPQVRTTRNTDIFLYNPHETRIWVDWETIAGSGTFPIDGGSTVSYRATVGSLPLGGAVYLSGSDVFWGVSTIDSAQPAYEWAYSLLPTSLLYREHYMGWAPGGWPDESLTSNGDGVVNNDSGVFLTVVQDGTTVFVDFDNDGTADKTYTLNRLQSQYIWDDTPGDQDGMSGARIWATGFFTMAFGQNPDTAPTQARSGDLGYVCIPGTDFIDIVMAVQKSVNPGTVPTALGSEAEFTLVVDSYTYPLNDGVTIEDTLPANWEYVTDSTTIIRPDLSTLSGAGANPAISGSGDRILTWSTTQTGGPMAENRKIIVTFTARTTQAFNDGDLSENRVKAVGSRTFGDPSTTQTFTVSDFAMIAHTNSSMSVTKTSDVDVAAFPGDTITYTVEIKNTGSSVLNNIAIYDPLPTGASYVANSSEIIGYVCSSTDNVRDEFTTRAYNRNSDGTVSWVGDWVESDATQSPTAGNVQITTTGSRELRLASTSFIYRQVDLSSACSAVLTLGYRTSNNLESTDLTYIEVAGSSSGPWTTALYFADDSSGILTYTIPGALRTSTTTVLIRVAAYGTNEYLYVDNVDITYTHNYIIGTFAAGDPPNCAKSGDLYLLVPGDTMTLTFQVTVDNPFPTGQNEITNTVYVNSSEIKIPISASVTDPVVIPSALTGEVGDLVWLDINGDGIRDPGEPGLSNVQVTLKDRFGTPVASTFTDSNGRYRFTGIAPGTGYYVEITSGLPPGLVQTAPAGRSDRRTNAFDLAAGGVYLDADLGFTTAAGTGTVGDFVWNDANANGIQDSGELGIAGVTVLLYRDVDGDGVFEPGGDDGAAVATAVTGPDGRYLFVGVTADDFGTYDYFVYVDATQAALAGYDYTTSPVTRVIGLAPGEARLNNDFGFQSASPTYSYRDRVWFDLDGNQQDTGENGIAGVTVNLLNASRQVVATVTTDANGYFNFGGLQDGTFYYIEISDTAGKLTDFYGTTPGAIAGERQISNLTGNLDYTTGSAPWPNFGYTSRGSVGDTVFNDVDGDGVQDPGELGISGVTVKIYSDGNANGVIDPGDSVVATVVTDANGSYMFSGLPDGDYIVSIESPPSGYDFTGTDSDTGTAGVQLAVTITGGGNRLDIDFGFRVPPADQRSISGAIWNDINNNGDDEGNFDGGRYLANVTVELRDNAGNLVGTTTTNANGAYSFSGLADGTYTVRITDENNVLSGYNTTYEVTEGFKAESYNGQETVTVDSGNSSPSLNFGYYKPPVVTRAVIGEFGAFNEGGKVMVRWETLSEHGTLGFFLQRFNEKTGDYEAVNKKLLPGLLHAPGGGSYSYEDKKAKAGAYYTYRLEEVEAGGRRIMFGPWRVFTGPLPSGEEPSVELDPHSGIAGYRSAEQPVSDSKIARMTKRLEARLKAHAKKLALRGGQAKIYVAEDGIYFIDAKDIARVLDIGEDSVANRIETNNLRLRCMGRSVAISPAADNSGVYFYGEKRITPYSDENVYWLDLSKGVRMQKDNRVPKKPAEDFQYFYETVWEEKDQYPMTGLFSDPEDDFWMWDFVFPGYNGYDQRTIPVSTPGVAGTGNATLTVALQGATDAFEGDDHHAVLRINGMEVGEAVWDGLNAAFISAPVPASLLNDGENLVEIAGIKNPKVEYNYFYINNLQIVYPKSYTAVENHLAAENTGYRTIRMNGFTDPDIRVFDITNPARPAVLSGVAIEPSKNGNGDYQVSFQAGAVLRQYLALTPEKIKPCILIADQASNLKKPFNLGDYVIITSGDMVAAAQTLADYRTSRGHVCKVVDIEDIYDEFAYGVKNATAIRDFLAYAYNSWRIFPKYVLLAGDGSFDYKDNLGFGDSIIPALLTIIPDDGLRVTDNLYADVVGNDSIPEFAIGRIPAISADELLDYIEKVIQYESSFGAWTNQAILAADAPDGGGNFIADSEEVTGLFPDDYLLDRLYLDTMPIASARSKLVAGINAGRAYVNFIGHGTMFQIGNRNLFSSSDLSKLNNTLHMPVFMAMTCVAGDFGYPGYDGLSESLVLRPNGGAIAMWASSGFSYNTQSVELCKGFYSAVFIGGETVLGDAVRRSKENYGSQGDDLYHLHLYNLIGDPALILK